MSTRTTFRPHAVITAGSMAGSLVSDVTILQSLKNVSYEISWTGTLPVGTVSVEASNSYSLFPDGTVNNAGIWTPLVLDNAGTPTTTLSVSGSPGNILIDPIETDAYALRVIYTRASGTGTMTAIINAKVS